MKLHVPANAARFSQVLEEVDVPGGEASGDRFVPGVPAADLDTPVRARLHFRARTPLPLPDLWRGERLLFASDRAKAVIDAHCAGHAVFAPGWMPRRSRTWGATTSCTFRERPM